MKSKIGWVISALIAALLLFSAFGKFQAGPEVIEGMEKSGMAAHLLLPLAILETVSVLLFLIPRTAFFGVILLTGYMGGAIVTHLRMGDAFFIQTLVPILAWVGFGLSNFDATMRLIKNQK